MNNQSDGQSGLDQSDKSWMTHPNNVTVYDCLSGFSQEETLCGDDKWYCSQCKEHQNALKKMEIYRTPEFLMIHFKRFSHTRNSMFGSRKINMQIDFPINTLDLTQYLASEDSESPGGAAAPKSANPSQKRLVYDLYAVSNHYGSLNGGHYTAFCYNNLMNKWFEFDDSSVHRVSPKETPQELKSEIVTKAAYVLFYRRRK